MDCFFWRTHISAVKIDVTRNLASVLLHFSSDLWFASPIPFIRSTASPWLFANVLSFSSEFMHIFYFPSPHILLLKKMNCHLMLYSRIFFPSYIHSVHDHELRFPELLQQKKLYFLSVNRKILCVHYNNILIKAKAI